MQASKSSATKQQPVKAVAPTPVTPPTTSANAKKKKNKKGKGRGSDEHGRATPLGGDYDDMPPLEALVNPLSHGRPGQRTGLSPELDSIHISATASLSGSASATARFNATAAAQADLLATATDLYRKTDADLHAGVSEEQDYLGSLPSNIRNFVETAWASISSAQSDEMKQRTMYAIAHQMVLSGAGLANGLGKDAAGKFPSFPFDAAALTDPKFNQAAFNSWEQARKAALPSVNGRSATVGHPPRAPLPPADLNLMNDYDEDDMDYAEEDDYYSEDEVDENVDEDDEDDVLMVGAQMRINGMASATGSKKKNKKKKKKGKQAAMTVDTVNVDISIRQRKIPLAQKPVDIATQTPAPPIRPAVPVPVGTQPAAAARQQARDVTGAVTNSIPNLSPMPVARTQMPNPPPSSRAAGKQPMYPPATTATATPTTPAAVNTQQPVRSARAAAKAPAPAHAYPHNHPHHHPSPPSSNASAPQKHRPPNTAAQAQPAKPSNKIWSTNSTEERERIKEFWLGLGEDERRGLVKIEKETVLRKMKEQQKHSCSCAVCGRKRSAIEEELEVLYDAYYEELEQYANYQQQYASSGGTIPPPPGPGPFPGSVELDKNGAVVSPGHNNKVQPPPRGKNDPATNGRKRVPESEFDEDDADGDDYEEDDYEDEDEDDEDEDEDDVDADGEEDVEVRNRPANRRTAPAARARNPAVPNGKVNGRDDLFTFGGNMAVAGPDNILTVADDLLKNDGQKFLEMMEQLAERRMQKEEEAADDLEDDSEEEDEDDGEEDEDEDDDDEDDDDDDDEEVMTEEQKMEEGKRMFSIFAARMFEQRVLQAYREKVAQERQLQLLRELEDEDKLSKEREAKKQKENQKKKDKKRLQKLAKEEERAAKAAEKAADEVAQKEKQLKLEEELKKKKEEERVKREAVRKTQEEEKAKKEEERRKRIAEDKEREAERERKRKEKEEKAKADRKEREEKERKAKEERDAKLAAEKAVEKAKREQQEKEEREKRLAKEREEKAEREAKERLEKQHQQQRATAAKPRSPPSPRNATGSGSSQRTVPAAPAPKKILNKPVPVSPTAPTRQAQRPTVATSVPSTPITAQAQPQQMTPSVSTHGPPTPIFPPVASIAPPMLSPRTPFAPPLSAGFGNFAPMSSVQQMPPPIMSPSSLQRNFSNGHAFESGYGRGLCLAAPIGPPSKANLVSPISPPNNTGSMPTGLAAPARRMTGPDPGPITRPLAPIAPIARPTTEGTNSGSGSGAASPIRRSPSPKSGLGSSALAADDDEVVMPPNRRVAPGVVGQGWQSPRNSIVGVPWGAPAASNVFASTPRPMSAANNLWGNANPTNLDWPGHQPTNNFFGNPFVNHNPSPPPHNGS